MSAQSLCSITVLGALCSISVLLTCLTDRSPYDSILSYLRTITTNSLSTPLQTFLRLLGSSLHNLQHFSLQRLRGVLKSSSSSRQNNLPRTLKCALLRPVVRGSKREPICYHVEKPTTPVGIADLATGAGKAKCFYMIYVL